MRLFALIIAVSAPVASSADELALFKESAAKILVEMALVSAEKDAYICISIEGKAPSAIQMASFQTLGIREVGPPSECEYPMDAAEGKYFRKNSKQSACSLSVDHFQFHAFTNASASVGVTCGETNGRGQVANFEKHEGVWVYTGSSEHFVL